MTITLLQTANEILTAAIVINAISILLYNLSRNMRDRVTRTSGGVLACVTIAYTADVFISLQPNPQAYEMALRVQWIGVAFIPAALFHLSDALMATTGLPSRGRRRFGVRLLYAISTIFVILAIATDLLIQIELLGSAASLNAGPVFPVYVAYFLSTTTLAFVTVQRARRRCLTRATRRRMAYLQFAMLTPAFGIFPYSVLLGPGGEFSLPALVLVNVANAVVVLMLVFLSYPLSFFGSNIPDRVVKAELLSFFMQGPATGMLALVTIVTTLQATRVLGLTGAQFMPFAVVAVVLMWEWFAAISLPTLERLLIYRDEDSTYLNKLRNLSDRLLSKTDLLQLADAILQAACNYLRVDTAFVFATRGSVSEIITAIGPGKPSLDLLQTHHDEIIQAVTQIPEDDSDPVLKPWNTYWITPLYSIRPGNDGQSATLTGILGIQARAESINLTSDECERLERFIHQLEQTLDDLTLQDEIYAALEGLLPQITMTRVRAAEVEYLPGRVPTSAKPTTLPPDDKQLIEQVRAALRHYWGGPGLTHSRLLELQIVRDCQTDTDTPAQALRNVLQDAIERQRPEGERKTTDPEWTIYNILDWRFLQGNKVNDVAKRLHMSHSDFYRKQRIAIEAVAHAIEAMETDRTHS